MIHYKLKVPGSFYVLANALEMDAIVQEIQHNRE